MPCSLQNPLPLTTLAVPSSIRSPNSSNISHRLKPILHAFNPHKIEYPESPSAPAAALEPQFQNPVQSGTPALSRRSRSSFLNAKSQPTPLRFQFLFAFLDQRQTQFPFSRATEIGSLKVYFPFYLCFEQHKLWQLLVCFQMLLILRYS